MDEDGFDYMKIAFLRDIKAQQRSLRCVFITVFLFLFTKLLSFYIWPTPASLLRVHN